MDSKSKNIRNLVYEDKYYACILVLYIEVSNYHTVKIMIKRQTKMLPCWEMKGCIETYRYELNLRVSLECFPISCTVFIMGILNKD